MAITKRRKKSGFNFQVKLRDNDGSWISETYSSIAEARVREAELIIQRKRQTVDSPASRTCTLNQYFEIWFKDSNTGRASDGWRVNQQQMYKKYVCPVIGSTTLRDLLPIHIEKVLTQMKVLRRSPQMLLHVYNLVGKMLKCAVESYALIERSPVLKTQKPKVPTREAAFLDTVSLEKLLNDTRNVRHGVGIWLQSYAGLRIGEVQYLKWEQVDFETSTILVCGTYLRKEKRFQHHPKGKRSRRVPIPPQLKELLLEHKSNSKSEFVAGVDSNMLSYFSYMWGLQQACQRIGISKISSHGLRHSSSELYMKHGASRDDLRILFGHSSSSVTDRYVHDKGHRLFSVAANVCVEFSNDVPKSVPQQEA